MRSEEIKEIDRRIELKRQHLKLLKLEIDDLGIRKLALMELYRKEYAEEVFDDKRCNNKSGHGSADIYKPREGINGKRL